MIMSYERHAMIHARAEQEVDCTNRDHCFNNVSKCGDCIKNKTLGLRVLAPDFYSPLKTVGAEVEGYTYPLLSGWLWSNAFGLLSKGTYIGWDGELVYVPECGPYHQVVLPQDKKINLIIHT
jgi:hypothetical protein